MDLIRHQVDFHIYYEDTDLSGFVYHSNYLKYFERGREHLIGVEYLANLYKSGVHFVVSKAELNYHFPAKHGDRIAVVSEGTFSKSPAIPFKQSCYLIENDQLTKELLSGQVTIVALNMENRPVRMPEQVIKYFQSRANILEQDMQSINIRNNQ